jgi:hypothetical protein
MEIPRGQAEKRASEAGRELGRLGATKGGKARAQALSPAERSEIARRAVRTRWARAGLSGGSPPEEHREHPDQSDRHGHSLARSTARGPVDLGPVEVECHVLDDGTRAIARDELLRALAGHTSFGEHSHDQVRRLRRVEGIDDLLTGDRLIRFRASGGAEATEGFGISVLVDACELVLSARDSSLLKKKQMPLAAAAEAIVRGCAADGVTGLVDRGTGYDKVSAGQFVQLRTQATIADGMGHWCRILPGEFWAQLARLEGARTVPAELPIGWAHYVLAFVYDAVEPDIGRELRREHPRSRFAPTFDQWLLVTGGDRVRSGMRQVVRTMNDCADMDEFRSTFAKVLLKAPRQLQMIGDGA